jgi:hypothetical protein
MFEPSKNIGIQKRKYSIVMSTCASTSLPSIDYYLRNKLLPYIPQTG